MCILIVEDDPITSKILSIKLQKNGFSVQAVERAEAALEYFANNGDVELLLTDIMLPGIDGIELIEKIKEIREYKYLPVIVYSSKNDKETVYRAIKLGCCAYITKPSNLKELINKVTQFSTRRASVLTDKIKVRIKFSMENDEYDELFQLFTQMVIDKAKFVEAEGQNAEPRNVAESLLDLHEGSSLVGAERLHTSLQRLQIIKQNNEMQALQYELPSVIRELETLKNYLLESNLIKMPN